MIERIITKAALAKKARARSFIIDIDMNGVIVCLRPDPRILDAKIKEQLWRRFFGVGGPSGDIFEGLSDSDSGFQAVDRCLDTLPTIEQLKWRFGLLRTI